MPPTASRPRQFDGDILIDKPEVVVLNKADIARIGRYGREGYYQNKYYSRYGYTD